MNIRKNIFSDYYNRLLFDKGEERFYGDTVFTITTADFVFCCAGCDMMLYAIAAKRSHR